MFDGDPVPPQKGGGSPSPIFGPYLLWPNGWMDQDGTWHGGGPCSRPHSARRSSPPPKRWQSPQFSAHFYCRQTARCIKMSLHMAVGLSPGYFVLYGDAAPSPKGEEPLNFRPIFIVAKRLDASRCHLVWR